MRRLLAVSVLVLTGCGGGDAVPGGGGAVEPEPAAEAVPAERWVDRHFAPGWFPELARAYGGAPPTSPGGEPVPTFAGPSDPAEDASTAPRTERVAELPDIRDRGLSAGDEGDADEEIVERMAGFEEEELNPRFGGVFTEEKPQLEAPKSWQRSKLAAGACRLSIGDDETLPLDAYQATVSVEGFRARVVLDLVYTNPEQEDLEGTLKLRLPDEAAVHYLAFGDTTATAPLLVPETGAAVPDLAPAALHAARGSGELFKEARIVPREEAQRAYAQETARAVDPALLEWIGAGVFSTRVYPLLPGKTHRITIGYDVDLVASGDWTEFSLQVPADVPTSRVTLAHVHDPRVSAAASARPDARTDRTATHTRMTWEQVAGEQIRVRIPGAHRFTLAGDDPAIGPHVATVVSPEIPASAAAVDRRAVFLVDTSLSTDAQRMNLWLDLLAAILERNRGDLEEFAVLFFGVETWWWQPGFAPNEAATVETLLADASQLPLEGATDLGAALAEADRPAWATSPTGADLFLLSDGNETWGAVEAETVAGGLDRPVFSYATGLPGTDTRALRALARATGGAVFSVTGRNEVEAAATAHRNRPWALRAVELAGCSDLQVDGRPATVHPGQRLRIAGRGTPADGASLVLTLEQDGTTSEVRVPIAQTTPSVLATRVYGEIATATLESLAPVARDDARSYALHYGVAGETCSLLMLEDQEAYDRYGIVAADEAETVRQRPVSAVLAECAGEADRMRGDARERFLAWLDRLERTSGVEFDDLDAVRAAARDLPVSAFEVSARPITCTSRVGDEVPAPFRALLESGELTYDAAFAEADRRRATLGSHDALRALSSLVESDPGSTDLQRDLAFTFLDWAEPGQAYGLLWRAAVARPHIPETYRSSARCLARMGRTDAALLVHEVASRGAWSGRFGAFPLIHAMDELALLRRIERGELTTQLPALAEAARGRIAERFLTDVPDLVVTLTWNTDRTDIDLHVTDPNGEECYYEHRRTALGGAITEDVTTGLGPEMFVLGRAAPGEYVVAAKYFGSDALRKTLRTRCFLTIARHFGTADEIVTRHAFVLQNAEDEQEIARFVWE